MSITLTPEIEKTSIVFSKKESYKISEDMWWSKIEEEKYALFNLEVDTKVMKKKDLEMYVKEGQLVCNTYIRLAEGIDTTKFEGAVTMSFKKSGAQPFSDPRMACDPENTRLEEVHKGLWGCVPKLYFKYDTKETIEKFLEEYIEDGFVTVELRTKLSLKKDLVDGRNSRKVNLAKDIKKLPSKKETCDYLVICQGTKFPCHKAILSARSAIFSNMFTTNMSEATGKWEVKDSTPEAVQHMVDFIYSGDIDYASLKQRPKEVLHLANFYDFPDLAAAAKEMMLWQLLPENAVSTLVNFERYAATDEEVKKEVIGFIKRNANAVVNSKDWDVFQQNFLSLAKDVVQEIS